MYFDKLKVQFWLLFATASLVFLFGCAYFGKAMSSTADSSNARAVLGFFMILIGLFFAIWAWRIDRKIGKPASPMQSVAQRQKEDEALRRVFMSGVGGKQPRPFKHSDSDTAEVKRPLDADESRQIDELMSQLQLPGPDGLFSY